MSRMRWDKESIKLAFKVYSESGNPLHGGKLRKENGALYGAILHHFKSYKAFIEEIGINYEEIAGKQRWTNEKVIEEFKKFESEGYGINVKSVAKHRRDLFEQILSRFGSYQEFVEKLGYDYKEIRKFREWKREEVVEALVSRYNEGQSMHSLDLINEFRALYKACIARFGSYREALECAGLNYYEQVGDMYVSSAFGNKFERLLANMFEDLDKGYIRHSREVDGIVPDFFDKQNNAFIDAKLSSWTVFNSETIEKYLPHCSKLVIVYLRGKQIQREIDGVELRHVSHYFEELRKHHLEDYIEKFDNLMRELESTEKEAV